MVDKYYGRSKVTKVNIRSSTRGETTINYDITSVYQGISLSKKVAVIFLATGQGIFIGAQSRLKDRC